MQSSKLFPKPDLLEEEPTDNDLINVEEEVGRVGGRLDRFIKQKRSAIVAYLGPFGAGKSSVLMMIESQRSSYKWVTFELWRYANRQEIWDGFVIRVAAALNGKTESDMADQVEGRSGVTRSILQFCLLAFAIFIVVIAVSFGLWEWLKGTSEFDLFSKAFLKYVIPAYISLVLLMGAGNLLLKIKVFQAKRPLRRVFELENLLRESLLKTDRPLIVVIEDVDRTTDDGAVFLETLKHFIDKHASSATNPILVVAPQTQNAFDAINNRGIAGFERSLKIYDETIYFGALLDDPGVEKFLDALDIDTKYKGKLIQVTKLILNANRNYITIRFLKHIFREVGSFVDAKPGLDPVIAMTLMIARYIPTLYGATEYGTVLGKIFAGSPYNSDGISAFFRALVIASDNPDPTNVRQFVATFDDIEGEISYTPHTHQNQTIEGRITLNSKYRPLIEGTF